MGRAIRRRPALVLSSRVSPRNDYNRPMPRFSALLLPCVLLLAASCATAPQNPYPPFDGRWLFDYEASVEDDATLPPDFEQLISRLDREGRTDDHRVLEAIARKLRPPEILRIEFQASTMVIRGGGVFERSYELSNLNPTPGVEVKWDMVELEAKLTDENVEVTEHYQLSSDGNRLIIRITMDSPLLENPLEMRRVYMSSRAF